MTQPPASDWCRSLPVLRGKQVHLREPVASDAPSLLREICTPEACEYLPPPPTTVEGVEQTILRGIEWRRAGRGFCFAVQPAETGHVVGLIQFLGSRENETVNVSTRVPWEWGFVLGSGYWGTGLFAEASSLALDFAFEGVGIRRVEAWVVEQNHRANRALAKLGGRAAVKHHARAPDGRTGDFMKWTHRKNLAPP